MSKDLANSNKTRFSIKAIFVQSIYLFIKNHKMLLENQTIDPLKVIYTRKNAELNVSHGYSNWSKSFLSIRTAGFTRILPIESILFCKSDGNYASIYIESGETIFLSKTLKFLESKLPLDQFQRVHQSYLIRLSAIRKYIPPQNKLVLSNSFEIPVARSCKSRIKQLLNF